jgi:hypothetical protein
MNDINLEVLQLQNARFVAIPYGQKGPQTAGWQHNPQVLSAIPEAGNVGMLLGKQTGIMAIDFDGHWGRKHFDSEIGPVANVPSTVSWTSGKEGRSQMAFSVPVEYHDFLRTKKIAGEIGSNGKAEGLELRWGSVQSVLPPSVHPETGRPYIWLNSPQDVPVAELPDFVLSWWLAEVNPEPVQHKYEFVLDNTEREAKVLKCLEAIKQKQPVLGYDDWTVITWSVFNTLEYDQQRTIALMSQYWPEQNRGEYSKLLTSRYTGTRKRTIGTLYHYAGIKLDRTSVLKAKVAALLGKQ